MSERARYRRQETIKQPQELSERPAWNAANPGHCHGVARRRGVRRSASLVLTERDPVSLGQPIEGAAVDAEQLSGELLVPPGLPQHAADVRGDDFPEAQRRFDRRWRRAEQLRGQIFGEQDDVRGQGPPRAR